jgi:rod shape-determining protein MreB
MLDFLFGLFSYDLGIDLGTANTLVAIRNKGIAIREPSVVAMHKKTKQVIAIGTEAKKMVGKTPATIVAVRPLKDWMITDFDATVAMLKHYIKLVHEPPGGRFSLIPKIPKPKVVVGIPSGVTEVERRAVQDAALSAGARAAYLIEEPMAAAIGAMLSVETSSGVFIVDIGGGTTEMAVISLGGIVVNRSVRMAGDKMDEAVSNFLRLKYGLLVGEKTAEDLKIQIGSAFAEPKSAEHFSVVRGRDIETGLPRSIKISASEIREALASVVNSIVDNIADIIEDTPPELLTDILEKGIVLAGGGSLLSGIDRFIAENTKLPVWRADDPQTCVVRGCLRVLEDEELLAKVRVTGGLK